jgi:acyltransferase-like protein
VTSGLWLVTWLFQVIPIFFFVGGFSNLTSLDAARRRGDSDWTFVRSRLVRLLRPSLVFFTVWGVVQIAIHVLNAGAPTGPRVWDGVRLLRLFLPPGATLPFGPLWFLAVYLVVVAIAPGLAATSPSCCCFPISSGSSTPTGRCCTCPVGSCGRWSPWDWAASWVEPAAVVPTG